MQKRLRVVGFAIVTPFFFFKGGLNVGLGAIYANLGLLIAFLEVKMGSKFIAVFPLARYYHEKHGPYTTLLMSTGLTFGTISSLFGLQAGIINQVQFSLLVTTVILSAIVPTFVAQRWFAPSIGVEGEPIWMETESGNGEAIHIGDKERASAVAGTSTVHRAAQL